LRSAADSMQSDKKRTWEEFFATLGEAIDGKRPFTVVIEDPLASSYVQSYTAPKPDPQIQVEEYERTAEEEEDLGLKDINTEDYGYEQQKEVEMTEEKTEWLDGSGRKRKLEHVDDVEDKMDIWEAERKASGIREGCLW
jgi:zinc finger protein